MFQRLLHAAALLAMLVLALPAMAQWPRTVTDVLGREVTLNQKPATLLLGESMQLLTLSLIHPDPVSLLVGMGGDLRRADPQSYVAFQRKFPALASVPELTTNIGQTFSIERGLSLAPDLVILGAWQANSADSKPMLEQFAQSGVPVLFIDTFQKPLTNTIPTIRLLGEVLDRREQAADFIRFVEERMNRIRARVAASATPGPRVLLNAFPGRWPCCWAAGTGGSGEFLALVGGRNAAQGVLGTQAGGQISLEQVLADQPEMVIGTGLYRPGDNVGLQLGTGVDAQTARASLQRVMHESSLTDLEAVRAGRAHGLWNYFSGTAINVVGAEMMARWVRPDLFADLDPAATLAEINRRFAAVPFEGTYWTSLNPADDRPTQP
ncbi:periplasmic binding protein [Acetobacteraceae bacterium AT-5844]|nr:periplasmic binding protein [Acetobacteraceae bacterium AT-5844]